MMCVVNVILEGYQVVEIRLRSMPNCQNHTYVLKLRHENSTYALNMVSSLQRHKKNGTI